jgi:poly-gamma-glutamate synthase PgsB/CapB
MIPWAVLLTAAWVAFLLIEQRSLRRARESVPVRIMVTGTRGKSSLVRILTAGARVAEPATWGKITGDVPTLLLPGGDEVIRRRAGARLAEQGWLLRKCRRGGVRCLVVEAMTITPELMKAEARLLLPSVIALVNVRDDHQETLGDDPVLQRRAYLDSLPAQSRVVTRDPALVACLPRTERAVSGAATDHPDLLAGLAPVQRELVLLADEVLAALGLSSAASLQAMAAAARPMASAPRRVAWQEGEAVLLDAFSANDTESLDALWAGWRGELGAQAPWSVVLATRADRPLRTRRFCAWIAARDDVEAVYVTGSHRHAARALLRKGGVRVHDIDGARRPLTLLGGTVAAPADGKRTVLVGIGNARGLGLALRAGNAGEVA